MIKNKKLIGDVGGELSRFQFVKGNKFLKSITED